ncbi:hypothetical protein AMTRI_Chr03g141840 [Amborella trichopoda]
MSMKELVSQESALRAMEQVVTKRKKIHHPSSAIEMHWSDFGAENYICPWHRECIIIFWPQYHWGIDGHRQSLFALY